MAMMARLSLRIERFIMTKINISQQQELGNKIQQITTLGRVFFTYIRIIAHLGFIIWTVRQRFAPFTAGQSCLYIQILMIGGNRR